MIGATIDQFKIVQMLGNNAAGETFLAVHVSDGAKFVLKGISPRLLADETFRRTLNDDAVEVIKFEHPNVIALINVIEGEGRTFLVREYVEGQTLDSMMRTHGRFPLKQSVDILKGILKGIGYTHSEGNLHRFLNPSNVIVTPEGDVRVWGFGSVLQHAREQMFTPLEKLYYGRYFSAERIRQPETTDIRANIYSAGAILYELVTGEPPFKGNDWPHLQEAVQRDPLVPPSELNPSVPPELNQAILRALARQPEGRFQNAIEFYKDIAKTQAALPHEASVVAMPSGVDAFANGSGDDNEDTASDLAFNLPSEKDALAAFDEPGDNLAGFDMEQTVRAQSLSGLQAQAREGGLAVGNEWSGETRPVDAFGNPEPPQNDPFQTTNDLDHLNFGAAGGSMDDGGADFGQMGEADFGLETSDGGQMGGDSSISASGSLDFGGVAEEKSDDLFDAGELTAGLDFGEEDLSSFSLGDAADSQTFGSEPDSDLGGQDFGFASASEAAADPTQSQGGVGDFGGGDLAQQAGGNEIADNGGFDFGNDGAFDFGGDAPPATENASMGGQKDFGGGSGNNDGFDFGSDQAKDEPFGGGPTDNPAGSDPFGGDQAGGDPFGGDTIAGDPFGGDPFGGNPAGGNSGGDGFDFGGGNEAGGGDGFDFGGGNEAAGGDGFDFGGGNEAAGGGNDLGGDFGGGNDLGGDFGVGGNDPVGGDGFDFGGGGNEPAGGDGLDFGGGNDLGGDFGGGPGGNDLGGDFGAGNSGGFDFGADDGGSFDLGGDDADFGLGGGSSVPMDFANDPAFDQTIGGGEPPAMDPTPDPAITHGGSDLGSVNNQVGGFDFAEGSAGTAGADGDDPFGFGSDAGGGDFDFGGDNAVADSFEFGSEAAGAGGGDAFDFGGDPGGAAGSFDFGAEEAPPADAGDFSFDDAGGAFDFDAVDEKPAAPASAAPAEDFSDFGEGGFDDPFAGDTGTGGSAERVTTDDGAFSFEAVEEDGGAAQGLAENLAKAEKDPAESGEQKVVKARRVFRFDPKMLAITVGLAVVAVGGIILWLSGNASKKREEAMIAEVQNLIDTREYRQALGRIDTLLGDDPGSRVTQRLRSLRGKAETKISEQSAQVAELLSRANAYREEGNGLVDGNNDAYGTYYRVLGLEPQNGVAKGAADEIRQEGLKRVDSLLGRNEELNALKILAALFNANKGDVEVRDQYNQLKQKLKDEQSGVLQEKIETLYARNDFLKAVPFLNELEQIDPASKYLKKTKPLVLQGLVAAGQDAVSRKQFDLARDSYAGALLLAPGDAKIERLAKEVREEELSLEITTVQRNLERAIANKQYDRQFNLANKLSELEPGHQLATDAMDRITKEIARLESVIEEKKAAGRFKEVADTYEEIYRINSSEATRAQWQKYRAWAPPAGMSYVPLGSFIMGNNRFSATKPKRRVYLGSYYIDKHEVTNGEFLAFVQANPQWAPGRIAADKHDGNYLAHWRGGRPSDDMMNRPVRFVSWYAAEAYARWKGKRLPTEAEWEKAATGNTKGLKYWWGDYSDAKQAVYEFYPEKRPAKVGSFPENGYGVFEILGNVEEWVADTYDETFYRRAGEENPVNMDEGSLKTYRGGSFRSRGRDLTVFSRNGADPRTCNDFTGFRCAQDARAME
ncbi:SUMF1/EgtB/PvdO family nonheme iron enzyme [Acanthopleuribacter pedis]|uniref:SUMF1/EgtB/PvdO family nonheme iron enzyme n=1 Tax=Acanthopleuribacter pedis TaxID=442870 RepID=A0A8J7QMZ9_9BACT|nr:SUMF1/EgtB/PvdO family nonheme iron enzyme [Acanthopleuribacter pedis]MBO1320980.1 SUMF1/EgtB/PvdO family nonheme iron enzyme [Acanthopleuribacter pedis]